MRVRWSSWFPVVTFLCLLTFIGCSGSNSGMAPVGGKPAARTSIVAGDQSLVGGSNYPLYALSLAAPQGSKPVQRVTPAALTFVPSLGLYRAAGQATGNRMVTRFYTDSKGTVSAGAITETIPSLATWDTNYKKYPVEVDMAINITGGNLPGSGQLVTIFTDATGANTMKGSYTLSRNGIVTKLDLSRSSSGAVGGTITMVVGGITAIVDHLTGSIDGGFKGQVTVQPYGYKGTATLFLLTGAYSITLNVDGHVITGKSNASGGLDLNYGDGTKETIPNPLTVNLGTGGTTGGTTTATTTTTSTTGATTTSGTTGSTTSSTTGGTTGNPVFIGPSLDVVQGITSAGAMCGYELTPSGGLYTSKAIYWPTRTSNPRTLLQSPQGARDVHANGINASGVIVGDYTDSVTGNVVAITWKTPTSAPTALPNYPQSTFTKATAINDSGRIVGLATDISGNHPAAYWANSKAVPVFISPTSYYFSELQINNASQICGTAINTAYYWSSPSAQPILLNVPGNYAIQSEVHMNSAGTVVGFYEGVSGRNGLVWVGGNPTPIVLKMPAGSTTVEAARINDQGVILGADLTTNVPLVWTSPTAVPISVTAAAGHIGTEAIFNDGGFVAASGGPGGTLYFYPKYK
jgi:hypothetical protein